MLRSYSNHLANIASDGEKPLKTALTLRSGWDAMGKDWRRMTGGESSGLEDRRGGYERERSKGNGDKKGKKRNE